MRPCGIELSEAEGDDGQGEVGRDEEEDGGEEVDPSIGGAGDDVFLGDELEEIGDGLEEAEGADAVGADPVLEAAGDLALGPDDVGDDAGKNREEAEQEPDRPGQPAAVRDTQPGLVPPGGWLLRPCQAGQCGAQGCGQERDSLTDDRLRTNLSRMRL